MESKYPIYKPFLDGDSIRLLLLQPASSHQAGVECSLVHTSLAACDRDIYEKYTALSYVWGDPRDTRNILVDGYTVAITATLETALRDIRDRARVLRVWADALCIDQSNIPERNAQVRFMGTIYSTASHTIIYLGDLDSHVEEVFDEVPTESLQDLEQYRDKKITIFKVVKMARRYILGRAWFSRVWTFQELVLSRDPWIQCGRRRIRVSMIYLLFNYSTRFDLN